MKLPRSRPHSSNWASHSLSFTSVLRPGTFFTWRALTSTTSSVSGSHRAWKTGFQYTPVASIATWVTPWSTNQPTICRSTG